MKLHFKYTFSINLHNILCIILGTLINLLLGILAAKANLPYWLNSIGILATSCFLGPVGGSIVGFLSFSLSFLFTPYTLAYITAVIPLSLITSIMYQRTQLKELYSFLCTGSLIALTSTLIAVPINLLIHNGYMKHIWGNALMEMLMQNGNGRFFSSFLGNAFVEFPDKIVSLLITIFILKLHSIFTNKKEDK